jgi:hypothetical protein
MTKHNFAIAESPLFLGGSERSLRAKQSKTMCEVYMDQVYAIMFLEDCFDQHKPLVSQ